MGMKCVYFDKETEELIDKNFSKGKWGYKLFSKVIKELLTKYVEKLPTVSNLKKERKRLQKEVKKIEGELSEVEAQYNQMIEEERLKFELNEQEAAFLNDSVGIVKQSKEKRELRIKSYQNIFKKDVNEKEFKKLLYLANKQYPSAKGYVDKQDE